MSHVNKHYYFFILSLGREIVQIPDDKVYPSLHATHLPLLSPVPSVLHPKRQVILSFNNKYQSLQVAYLLTSDPVPSVLY